LKSSISLIQNYVKLLEAGVDLNYKRKYKRIITFNTLSKLYQTYFKYLSFKANEEIAVSEEDKDIVIFLLRVHFRQWIEVEGVNIKVYKDFPQQFEVIKEVNKYNHFFTPMTFLVGEVLFYRNSVYGSCNFLNGIPLAESLEPVEGTTIIATTQINYGYIKPK
jgi:hypothetical protein